MQKGQPSHGNFRDPFGLVTRMIRSGDAAAKWSLMQRIVASMATPFDILLSPFERRYIQNSKDSPGSPIILLIGPPRSGTTLVYQVLARYLDVSYFDNLSSLFPRSPVLGSSFFVGKARASNSQFESFYGNVAGWRAPNDGFHVWNRWLGEDRYKTPNEIDAKLAAEMNQFFSAWQSKHQKPFLNKNNRNTDCADLLFEAIDGAVFVEIRRKPVFIAQSLLLARERIQGSPRFGWGLGSADLQEGADRAEIIDSVCDQVQGILCKLDRFRDQISSDSYLSVTYEDFCLNPQQVLELILDKVPTMKVREGMEIAEIQPFSDMNKRRLGEADFVRIERRFSPASQENQDP